MIDGGNLVAEEDVMTKLPAIKTRFNFEGSLKCMYFASRNGATWRNYLRPHGSKFRHLSQVVSVLARICRNSANVLKVSQLSSHLSTLFDSLRLSN